VTRGQLPQRTGLPGLNGGGAAAAVPPQTSTDWLQEGSCGNSRWNRGRIHVLIFGAVETFLDAECCYPQFHIFYAVDENKDQRVIGHRQEHNIAWLPCDNMAFLSFTTTSSHSVNRYASRRNS